jgi:RimJ/RimL family protein N-acetyltransferase
LEPLTQAAVPGLMAAAGESRDSYGYTRVPADPDEMHAYVAAALDDEAAGIALPFVTWAAEGGADGRIVGSTRFLDLEYWAGAGSWPPGVRRPAPEGAARRAPSVAEIGSTWLAASAQRTPANTEAKLLMLTQAFEVWGTHRVTLKTDARNARSRVAIERLGAVFEGIRRAHVPALDGTIRDSAYFSVLAPEWPAIRERLRARLWSDPGRRAGA